MNNFKKYIVNKFPQLGKWIKYKFDIIWEKNEKDHELGGDYDYDDNDLLDDGDWTKPLEEIRTEREFFEIQKGKFLETMGCVGYGTLNGVELIAYLKWLMIWNKADRYTNKLSGTSQNGNSVTRVFESIRKLHGVVDEKDYPWNRDTFTWNEYYRTVPSNIIELGKNWLKQYSFNYQKVSTDHNSIKQALKKSPVGIGVYAWYKKGDKYYSAGNPNHWCIILKQNWGESYIILDSYEPYIKILDWNFDFGFARSFFLNKKEFSYNQEEIKKLMERGFKYIMRPLANGELYSLSETGLKQLTPEEARDFGIRTLEKSKELIGVTESLYNNLLK